MTLINILNTERADADLCQLLTVCGNNGIGVVGRKHDFFCMRSTKAQSSLPCANPESFVGGGPTLATFFFFIF